MLKKWTEKKIWLFDNGREDEMPPGEEREKLIYDFMWTWATDVEQRYITSLEKDTIGRELRIKFMKLLKDVKLVKNTIERRVEVVNL